MAASLGNATVNVLARTVLFEQSLKRSLKRMSLLTAGIFAGVGAANFFGGAVKDSIALEKQLAKIQTFLTDQPELIKQAFNADAVRGLSNELGISAIEVSEALYYMIGSGVDASEAMDAVRAAASSAVATVSDLGLVSNFTSSGLNAFGGTVDTLTGKMVDAQHINDLFFAALKEGKGTANDLAKYLSTAIPSAEGLGIGLGEIVSAASAATLTGKSARKVMTGLDYVMSGLGNSTKGVGEVFKDITGKSFPEFIAKGGTLQEAIKTLGSEVGIQQLNNVKGASTGIRAIQELLVVWEDYERIQGNVKNAEGAAIEGRDIMNQSLSRQLERMKTILVNFRGSVGDWLGPVLNDALNTIRDWAPKVKAFIGEAAAAVAAGWAVVAPLFQNGYDLLKQAIESINWDSVRGVIEAFFTGVMVGLAPFVVALGVAVTVFGQLAQVFGPVIDLLNQMKPLIVGATAVWVAYTVAQNLGALATLYFFTVSKAMLALQKLQVVWTGLVTAAQIIQIGATSGLAGVWTALNLIMSANPIGAVIAVIVGLGVALVYAWRESETFREVVIKGFQLVVAAVSYAVEYIVVLVLEMFRQIVVNAKAIFDVWQKLPAILGGGFAGDIAGAAQAIINGVDAVIRKTHEAAAAARSWANELQAAKAMIAADPSDAGKLARASSGTVVQAYKPQEMPKISTPNFSGGGYKVGGADAKKSAEKSAKELLKAVKTALDKVGKSTSKQTVETIKQNFDDVYAALKEAGKKSVIKSVEKVEKKLVDLAKKRDKVAEKLADKKDILKTLKDDAKTFMEGVRSTIIALGDVSQATEGIGTTYTGIRNRLRKAVAETQAFTAIINKLRALKLNDTSLQQLIEAGPAAMDQARALAGSGLAGVAEINNLQGQLKTAGDHLAKSGYDQFYKNGIAVAQGLVDGLEKEQAAIIKQMDKIADAMVKSIKKKLGIKSPSRVFADVGENVIKGLTQGMDRESPSVAKASAGVSQQIHFGPGSVSVAGVGAPSAERAGILTGQGIVQVLREKQVAAQLAGVL